MTKSLVSVSPKSAIALLVALHAIGDHLPADPSRLAPDAPPPKTTESRLTSRLNGSLQHNRSGERPSLRCRDVSASGLGAERTSTSAKLGRPSN